MRIDLGLILAMVLEYIFFISYADTLFYRKRNKYICCTIIAVGYIIHFAVCVFGNVILNIATSIIMHFLCFRLCYYVNKKSALFQSNLLAALNVAAEYLIIFIPYIGIVPNEPVSITPMQSFVLTLTSKLLYLIGIMIISRVFCNKKQNVQPVSLELLFIPVLTVVIITLLFKINTTSNLLSLVCFILIIINIIVFYTNQKMITAQTEKADLQEQRLREKVDYDEYMLLKETNRQALILNHDLKEHINALSLLIGSDNEKAQEYIKSIYGKMEQSRFTEYSDNKILNVLLTKKKKECADKGIQFFIDPIQAHLNFFYDMDIVTVFSNLINNAVESCMRSNDKRIYLNIHTENENFVVINIENTSDTKPIVIDGRLRTHKDNEKLHGIGMNSIKRTLSDYNGSLTWKYNETDKIFSTTIIIKNLIS